MTDRVRRGSAAAAGAALLIFGAGGVLSQSAPPATAAAASGGFTILQVNDTYKIEGLLAGRVGGMARLRALRLRVEAEGRETLLLHAGDFLFPSVMSRYLGGEAMVATLNRLDGSDGFDERMFVTFGNHEFDPRDRSVLLLRMAESRFRWLTANLRFRPTEGGPFVPFAARAPHADKTRLVEIGGIRVGLFGVSGPGEPREWADYGNFDTLVSAANAAVAELRGKGAELVVALTHQELPEDVRLAELVPGIDRIVGGHEHVALERRVGGTWITKADADARSVVRIDVDRRANGIETSHRLVVLDESMPPDPETQGLIGRWLARLEQSVRKATGRNLLDVVATTEHVLEGVEPAIRGRETALGNFLADALRDRLETDLAIVNGGTVRVNDDVPAGGELRVYELEGIFYYDDPAVAFELTGTEILDLLRKSVSGATIGHGRFLQVSGIRFRYHALPGPDGETTRVEAAEVELLPRGETDWQRLEPERRYTVASTGWLFRNGCRDGYPRFGQGCGAESPRQLERLAPSFRRLTEEAIARLPGRRIRTAIDGRIVRIEEPGGTSGLSREMR
jgi:5'-nucleotidase